MGKKPPLPERKSQSVTEIGMWASRRRRSQRSSRKVVSRDIDLGMDAMLTGRLSIPLDWRKSSSPLRPKRDRSVVRGSPHKSPILWMLSILRMTWALGPIPGRVSMPKSFKNSSSRPGWTSTKPPGLALLVASFARSLLGPTPTETRIPSCFSTLFLISWIVRGKDE